MLVALDLPQWVAHSTFIGVLTFGDWSVLMTGDPVGTGDLLIMDNEVAPDN